MSEKYSNSFSTTLNGAITNLAGSLVVASASAAPASGNFRIIVADAVTGANAEIMLVTAVSGQTFTVSRGQEGTAAVSHGNGSSVTGILTKGALDQIIADNQQYDVFANLPVAEKAGRIFRCSDSPWLFRDNGASWQGIIAGYSASTVPATGWTALNGGTSTFAFAGGMATFGLTVSGNNQNRIQYRAKPSTPYKITLQAMQYPVPTVTGNFYAFGICFLDSVSGKFVTMQAGQLGTTLMRVFNEKWTNSSSFSAEYTHDTFTNTTGPLPTVLQIQDTGTNFVFNYGWFPDTLRTINTVSNTDFMASYDSVGVFIRQDGTDNAQQILKMLSWTQG